MATATYWQRGDAIDYLNSSGSKIDADTIILAGSLLGIAGADIPNGATGAVIISGIYELPKEYAASDKALTLGQKVQWDDSNHYIKAAVEQVIGTGGDAGKVTTEASPVHGIVVAAAASADTTCLVKINVGNH